MAEDVFRRTKRVLEAFTKYLPPGSKQNHRITLAPCGLCLTLMLGDRCQEVFLSESDFRRDPDALAAAISAELHKIQDEDDGHQGPCGYGCAGD